MDLKLLLLLIFSPYCLCELSDVNNVTYSIIDPTIFTLEWEPPDDFEDGDMYQIIITQNETDYFYPTKCGNSSKNFDINTNLTSYNITDYLADSVVYLTVYHVREQDLSNGYSDIFKMPAQKPYQELDGSIANNSTDTGTEVNLEVMLHWHYPCPPGGNLSFTIELNGTYSEDASIFTSENLLVPLMEEYEQQFDLSQYLNYSFDYNVTIIPLNEAGTGLVSELSFKTEDNYPGKPQNLSVEDNGTEVTVSWEEPEGNWGKIVNYHVVLESLGPATGGFDCDEDKNTTTWVTTNLTATFHSKYYYNYNVRVAAETAAGLGSFSEVNHQTMSIPPEEVQEFIAVDTSEDNEVDNVELKFELMWKNPCASNGKWLLTLELNGQYTEDPSNSHILKFTFEDTTENLNVSKNLRYSYNYNATIISSNEAGEGGSKTIAFTTKPNYPGEIEIKNVSYNNQNMIIEWGEPELLVGKVSYELNIKPVPLNYDCNPNDTLINFKTDETTYETPVRSFYSYEITITPNTTVGPGNSSRDTFKTPPSEPDVVDNITYTIANKSTGQDYDTEVRVTFNKPCRFNDKFQSYVINYVGTRENFDQDNHTDEILKMDTNTHVYSKLKPQYDYTVSVIVKTDNFESNAVQAVFLAPAGVPIINSGINMSEPVLKEYNLAEFTLNKTYFDNTNGDILFYAVILSPNPISTAGKFAYWGGTSEYWPETGSTDASYITEKMWNPFSDSEQVKVLIGENGTLAEKTTYYLVVRAFTQAAYIDSDNINFITGEIESYLGIILGATFGSLAILTIGIVVVLWKLGKLPSISFRRSLTSPKNNNVVKLLKEYNETDLKNEFLQLNMETQDLSKSSTGVATLPSNMKKNRYKNILPYDSTRVKLSEQIYENFTDYINASYIKGFSGKPEYIATQGPLPSTTKDFWRMIWQEDVHLIVMAAQFQENNQIKCTKYFPDLGKFQDEDDLSIKCVSESSNNVICNRQFEIQMNDTKRTVTHLQLLTWPDFGVPNGTSDVINICKQMRQLNKSNMVVIHCSAGVGRTGTLIAVDIGMQILNSKQNVDIKNTIKEMRQQRALMVQTPDQYVFIHKCLHDYLKQQGL